MLFRHAVEAKRRGAQDLMFVLNKLAQNEKWNYTLKFIGYSEHDSKRDVSRHNKGKK